jgi:hypothetical protein
VSFGASPRGLQLGCGFSTHAPIAWPESLAADEPFWPFYYLSLFWGARRSAKVVKFRNMENVHSTIALFALITAYISEATRRRLLRVVPHKRCQVLPQTALVVLPSSATSR